MRYLTHGLSDVGIVRSENQDSLLIQEKPEASSRDSKGTLLVVADGMGGLEGGEVASRLSVEAMDRHYFSDASSPDLALQNAAKEANRSVFREASKLESGLMMGSTLTAASIIGEHAWIVQVGDSRAYLYRDGSIRQITKDHSLVQELADRAGDIDLPPGNWTFSRNIVTRGLGLQDDVEVDLYEIDDLREGDVLLLSSDGFHELLEPEEMASCIERHGTNLEAACQEYIDTARERGGPDNITVVLARASADVNEGTATAPLESNTTDAGRSAASESSRGRWLPVALFSCLIAGVLLGLYLPQQLALRGERLDQLRDGLGEAINGVDSLDKDELRRRLERLRALLPGRLNDPAQEE